MSDDADDDLEANAFSNEASELLISESADPMSIVERAVPKDILIKYDVVSYRSAAIIMAESFPAEYGELLDALRAFTIKASLASVVLIFLYIQ